MSTRKPAFGHFLRIQPRYIHKCLKKGVPVMKVRDIMTKNVEVLNPFSKISEAARKMIELNIGILPVSENGKVVGMVTDRDIAIRAVAEERHPPQELVNAIMTPDVHYCYESQDIDEAAEIMRSNKIRRLVVLNENMELVGICSLGDLAVEGKNDKLSGEVLREISKPSKPEE
ncbi:MAG: CBS domain-containing protein [candidate division Zixibacteria bacterium]|nr:CBS domain-containing protein [candidate division Zixibacteria bacterium]